MPTAPVLFLPALQSYWLVAHVTLSFTAYALFGLSACAGAALLCGGAAPETAAPLIRRLNLLGLVIFTIGGLFFGSIWAHHSWGRFWAWDPKETWAFITWCAFLAILHFDHRRELPPRKLAAATLAAFAVLIFTYVGVNIFFAGLHSYAALEVSP